MKKTIAAFCVMLAAASPASAQIGGFGKKLLDKAKDEAEKAISKEIEDEPAPTEQSGPKKEAPLSAEPAPEKTANAPVFVQIPTDEMAWVAERKPFEAPSTVRAFIHDPNIIEATGVQGLKIDIRRPSSGPNYHTQVMTSDSASTASSGVFRLKVDGAEIASEAFGGIDRPKGFRDASVIEAMGAGETLTIEFGPADAPKSVSLPLAGFDEALSPPDINVDQGALMLSQNIGNRCVQREGKFSYKCACVQNEFVVAAPSGVHYGSAGPLLETAQSKCDANINANPLLGALRIQEALFGAIFSAAGASAPDGAVLIGDMAPGGPAHAIGLRTGDMIVKVGSAPAAQRLLTDKPFRPGAQTITVYSPLTNQSRDVRISLVVPSADMKMKHMAPFRFLSAAAAKAEKNNSEAEVSANMLEKSASAVPQPKSGPEKVSFTDPVGASCARDSRLSGLYDCGCISEKAGRLREKIADERFAEQQKYIPKRKMQLEAAQKQLAEARSEQEKKSALRAVKRAEDTLAELQVRPDPSSISESNVALYAYQGADCKIGDYMKMTEMKQCLASASSKSGIADPESYCICSANKAAELWLQSEAAYKSSIHVQAATQARNACRP